MSNRVTRKSAEYAAAKIAAIHEVPFAAKDADRNGTERTWLFDYEPEHGGATIREWLEGGWGQHEPFGSRRRTPAEFLDWANAYVAGACEFGGPEVRARLERFFEANPIAD